MNTIITIVMPSFNGWPFIKYSVKSILDQTLNNFKLIIINDGSNDFTNDFLMTLKDERIKIINKCHSGIIDSVNTILPILDTKYFARVDSDDIYFRNKFETQIDYLEHNLDTVILGTNAYYMSENGKISNLKINPPLSNKGIINNLFSLKRSVIQSTMVMRTEAFIKLGGYRSNVYPEDLDLYFRAINLGKLNNIHEPLSAIRMHNSYSFKNLEALLRKNAVLLNEYKLKNRDLLLDINTKSILKIYYRRMSLHSYLNNSISHAILYLLKSMLISPIETLKKIKKMLY